MSLLRPKRYETTEARGLRVLTCCGYAPIRMESLNYAERATLAGLCDEAGALVAGGREKCRILLESAADRLKASDEELDEPTELAS